METRIPLEEFLRELPEELKEEVYDFANYLLQKHLREENRAWGKFSLTGPGTGLKKRSLLMFHNIIYSLSLCEEECVTALNWKGKIVGIIKYVLSFVGVHGRNENIFFVARKKR